MKKITFSLILIIFLIIVGNLVVSIISLWSKKDLLTSTQKQLAREKKEHSELMQQWGKINTPSFIEEQARDRLFLGQPGDVEVLLSGATPSGTQNQRVADTRQVWQQWWDLFFMQ